MHPFNFFRSLMSPRTPLALITEELALAYVERLNGQSCVEYAQSIVDYNNARIKRLEALKSAYEVKA